MKRKIASLLCALLLLGQMIAPSASAEGIVYFTAVNDSVLELTDATMPFWSGGYLYVPSTVFNSSEFGFSYSRNLITNRMVFFVPGEVGKALIFDLAEGTVLDGQGGERFPRAITRGSVVFLPVSLMANYFGLTYTSSKVSRGYVIRVRNQEAVLSDAWFIDSATSQLEYRYSLYQKALAAVDPTPGVQTGPSTPVYSGNPLYLCLRAAEEEKTAALLDVLDRGGVVAAFYFTADQLRGSGDLVRRMAASGQSVGLIADGADPERSVEEQLQEANQILWQTAGLKTRLCLVENAETQTLGTAEGWSVLAPDLDRSSTGLRTTAAAAALSQKAASRRGGVTIWLSDNVTAAGLRAFLNEVAEAGNRVVGLTETA